MNRPHSRPIPGPLRTHCRNSSAQTNSHPGNPLQNSWQTHWRPRCSPNAGPLQAPLRTHCWLHRGPVAISLCNMGDEIYYIAPPKCIWTTSCTDANQIQLHFLDLRFPTHRCPRHMSNIYFKHEIIFSSDRNLILTIANSILLAGRFC